MRTLAWLIFLLHATAAGAAPAADADKDPVTLLVTHPEVSELLNLENLVARGLLQVSGLRVIGIYHRDEQTDYAPAAEYMKSGPSWISLRSIDCALPDTAVFDRNDCSGAFDDLFAGSAGILFTGGPDIPPALYQRKTSLLTEIEDPARHRFEISLLYHLLGPRAYLAAHPRYAVLAVCLGMQSLNVATGGTLIQDIPSEVYGVPTFEDVARLPAGRIHRNPYAAFASALDVGRAVVHPIRFVAAHPLAVAGPVRVLSIHHQALDRLGRDLAVLARSSDGKIIEAVRHKAFPAVLGLQFHPEKRLLWDQTLVYRLRDDAPATNHVARWYADDDVSRGFHESIWRWFSARLTESAGAAAR